MTVSYICSECATHYPITPDLMVCPNCASQQTSEEPLRGVLEVSYENPSIDKEHWWLSTTRSWLFDMLPMPEEFFAPMPVGNTPLWEPRNLREELDLPNLFIKDDGANPTASFKDRASWLVSAFAKQHGVENIVLASTGNAGSSMAGIGAAAGQKITLFLPASAPVAKLIQGQQYGANLILVDGNYDKAFALAMEYCKRFGGMNRNTAYNPMTIEGKKTVSLEVTRQMGKAPDHVFVSCGDGCILSGVYKGFKDLYQFGLIDKVPTIWAVQSENSDTLTRAFNHPEGKFEAKPATTIADSISVDMPASGYHALRQLKEFGGRCITVADEDILKAQKKMSEKAGLFSEPAGATAFAGLLAARNEIGRDEQIVVLTTGHGLKDPKTAATGCPDLPAPIASLDELA
ncbi:threonine synthase [Sansalvadorimonas sp. 2012CJ34-2]|uniref:Threonine synthase n=1 Tax=Parendozoicomonas callyspongiae TaxID=2942213 RepID=A0ABT0PIZ3_9GAMM|nr:threonine synthase [Sansalvadorimonas sp. 2012CJ34-2]